MTAFDAIGARFIGVASQPEPRDYLIDLAMATETYIPPTGAASASPASLEAHDLHRR